MLLITVLFMKKYILLFILLFVLALTGYVWFFYYKVYSVGDRFGTLKKFSMKGDIFKTYEGEIVVLDYFPGSTGTNRGNKFYFSVIDPKVAENLRNIIRSGNSKNVTVRYLQYRKSLPWRGENNNDVNENVGQYIVDKVDVQRRGTNSQSDVQNKQGL